MEFILKIKEFFNNKNSFEGLSVYFLNNFEIFDMSWLRKLMCYFLFNEFKFVEKHNLPLKSLLN